MADDWNLNDSLLSTGISESFSSTTSSENSIDLQGFQTGRILQAEEIPHLMASGIETIDLPPQSPRVDRKRGYPVTTPSTGSHTKPSPRSQMYELSKTNLSSLVISVRDLDVDESVHFEFEPERQDTHHSNVSPIDPRPSSSCSALNHSHHKHPSVEFYDGGEFKCQKTLFPEEKESMFDDKENIHPNLYYHTSSSTRRNNGKAIVPLPSKPVQQKQMNTDILSHKVPKRTDRSKSHRRVNCDSLPDLSALRLSADDFRRHGDVKTSTTSSQINPLAPTISSGRDSVFRPAALRRHHSMSVSRGFR